MKISYKQKLFFYFVAIFALFTAGVVVFEQSRERKNKTEALADKLDAYSDMVYAALRQNSDTVSALDSLITLFPRNIRLTVINRQGSVLYDNVIQDVARMENHVRRPEIQKAAENRTGMDIRTSTSNDQRYLYYAKQFPGNYVRVALPYDIQVRHFLKADNLFLYYSAALFLIILLITNFVAGRFGNSIRQLRDFTAAAENGRVDSLPVNFPHDELGEIGSKIAEIYLQLRKNKKAIALELEKLLQHVYSSEEGLCFFACDHSVEFYNGLFIQYLNIIIDEANSNPAVIFTDPAFEKITTFLTSRNKTGELYFETQINKQGRNFTVRVNIFDDESFEIIINDVTRQEKTRLLKQEMTGNITHELRTPLPVFAAAWKPFWNIL